MKFTFEIQTVETGEFTGSDGAAKNYTRLIGRDQSSYFVKAVAFDALASALDRELQKLVGPDEELASRRLAIECRGEFKEKIRENGKRDRSFQIHEFAFLNGPSLELTRSRRDGAAALLEAGALVKEGNVAGAYRSLETFVASFSRRPAPSRDLELGTEIASNVEAVREEAPVVDASAADPEEAAARRFAERDGAVAPDAAASVPAATEAAADAPAEESEPAAVSEEVSAEVAAVAEEAARIADEAFPDIPSADVLDEPVSAPVQQAAPAAARPAPVVRGRPGMARPAQAPAARPAPVQAGQGGELRSDPVPADEIAAAPVAARPQAVARPAGLPGMGGPRRPPARTPGM